MSLGALPAWLFSNNNGKSETSVLNRDNEMAKKDNASKAGKEMSGSLSNSSTGAPPALLMDMVEDFLSQHSFKSAHSAFKKQREKKGWKLQVGANTSTTQSLSGLFEAWDTARSQATSHKDGSEASGDDDSSSGESDADDVSMDDAEDGASSSSSSISPSSSSSSSSGSEDGKERKTNPEQKITQGLKRKEQPASSSSSSASSSDSDTDGDSSSSSNSENKPKLKRQKTKPASPARLRSSTSSSSSASDSSSDSESTSSSESEGDTESAAKVPLPDSDSSSESSSSESSESDSTSGENVSSRRKEIVPAIKDSSDSSVTLEKSPNLKATSLPPLPPDPVLHKGLKGKKKQNEAFSRIPKDIKVDPKFASNAYVSVNYSQRAHEDLIVTKGKGFTKEKNKKKRGSYRGGPIDISHNGAVYFDD